MTWHESLYSSHIYILFLPTKIWNRIYFLIRSSDQDVWAKNPLIRKEKSNLWDIVTCMSQKMNIHVSSKNIHFITTHTSNYFRTFSLLYDWWMEFSARMAQPIYKYPHYIIILPSCCLMVTSCCSYQCMHLVLALNGYNLFYC